MNAALGRMKRGFAASRKVPVADVVTEAAVPEPVHGLVVVRAWTKSGHAERGDHGVALVDGEQLIFGFANAVEHITKTFGYGANRTISALAMASLIGPMEATAEPTRPVLTAETIADMRPDWARHMFLPRETIIDALPSLEYWNSCGEPPLWLTRVVFAPDGSHSVTTKTIWDFGE